jgi:hypothetical protein
MTCRNLGAVLSCVCCLAFVALSFSPECRSEVRRETDDADRAPEAAGRRPIRVARPGTLERRVQDLENQVQTLTRELESLRKEIKPLANQPGRPRLLKAVPSDD